MTSYSLRFESSSSRAMPQLISSCKSNFILMGLWPEGHTPLSAQLCALVERCRLGRAGLYTIYCGPERAISCMTQNTGLCENYVLNCLPQLLYPKQKLGYLCLHEVLIFSLLWVLFRQMRLYSKPNASLERLLIPYVLSYGLHTSSSSNIFN